MATAPVLRVLLVSAPLLVGCGVGTGLDSPTSPASRSAPPMSEASALPSIRGEPVERLPLPSGFPVLAGARPGPLRQDDPGLIARWTTARLGSAAYDFYAAALPAAGYEIVGLYPGGEWAVIRFRLSDRTTLQVVVHGIEGGAVAVEVRLDRP